MTTKQTSFPAIQVPTFPSSQGVHKHQKTKKTIRKRLRQEDIKSFHQTDPFMYYSFRDVRLATIFCQDTDQATRDAAAVSSRGPSSVERMSRVSFETDALSLMRMMMLAEEIGE